MTAVHDRAAARWIEEMPHELHAQALAHLYRWAESSNTATRPLPPAGLPAPPHELRTATGGELLHATGYATGTARALQSKRAAEQRRQPLPGSPPLAVRTFAVDVLGGRPSSAVLDQVRCALRPLDEDGLILAEDALETWRRLLRSALPADLAAHVLAGGGETARIGTSAVVLRDGEVVDLVDDPAGEIALRWAERWDAGEFTAETLPCWPPAPPPSPLPDFIWQLRPMEAMLVVDAALAAIPHVRSGRALEEVRRWATRQTAPVDAAALPEEVKETMGRVVPFNRKFAVAPRLLIVEPGGLTVQGRA